MNSQIAVGTIWGYIKTTASSIVTSLFYSFCLSSISGNTLYHVFLLLILSLLCVPHLTPGQRTLSTLFLQQQQKMLCAWGEGKHGSLRQLHLRKAALELPFSQKTYEQKQRNSKQNSWIYGDFVSRQALSEWSIPSLKLRSSTTPILWQRMEIQQDMTWDTFYTWHAGGAGAALPFLVWCYHMWNRHFTLTMSVVIELVHKRGNIEQE